MANCVTCETEVRKRQHILVCDSFGQWEHLQCSTRVSAAIIVANATRLDYGFPVREMSAFFSVIPGVSESSKSDYFVYISIVLVLSVSPP